MNLPQTPPNPHRDCSDFPKQPHDPLFCRLVCRFREIRQIQSQCHREFAMIQAARSCQLTKAEANRLYTLWLQEQEG